MQQKGYEMKKEFKMSQARFDELKAELEYNKTTRADEVSEQIKIARGFGDLSENSEYDEAKNEQAKLYGRIAEVENILANAVIIEEGEDNTGRVGLGCRVRVLDLEMDEEEEYSIVGSQEADPMHGAMSEESPFGKALMGAKVGDVVKVEAPVGVISYKVERIER